MNEIVFEHETKPELRFTGQLLAETGIEPDFNGAEKRRFKLQVYAIEGGGFVATLQYETSCEDERPVLLYEDMDLFKDVENFFFVFEASEVMRDWNQISRGERAQRMAGCQRIAKSYESGMFKFLDLARIRARQQKFGDRIAEKANRPSIFRTLGLKR